MPLGALLVYASVSGNVSLDSPQNDSYERGNVDVNVTFPDLANVTFEYNTSGAFTLLNSSNNETGSYSFVWQTTSFSDGVYGLRAIVVNSSNQSDNETVFGSNITIDNTPPNFTIDLPALNSNYSDGGSIAVNISVTDNTSGIADGANCNPTLNGVNTTFNGSVLYTAATGMCNGTLMLNDPSGLADGTYTLAFNVSDRSGNSNATSRQVLVDNTPPAVFNIVYTDRTPNTTSLTVNITLNVSDTSGIVIVQLNNGSSSFLMANLTTNTTSGTYQISSTLSGYNCQGEELCGLTVLADDTAGNTNNTVSTSGTFNATSQKHINPLYVDNTSPVVLANATVNATGIPGQQFLLSVLWSDVSLNDQLGPQISIEENHVSPVITQTIGYNEIDAFANNFTERNYTNYTRTHAGDDEGFITYYNITLNDTSNLRATHAFIVVTQNVSPTFDIVNVVNNSVLGDDEVLRFTSIETGVGLNISSLTVNASRGGADTIVTYADNTSLFNCTCAECNATQANASNNYVANYTCEIALNWPPIGLSNFTFTIKDLYNNTNSTLYLFTVVDVPDIANVSINGVVIANATPESSFTASYSNASKQTTFNWSVNVTAQINTTTISFVNVTDIQATSTNVLPASAVYNVTAGKNYLTINVTLNDSPTVDVVQVNLTANVPLNLSAVSDQYTRGMVPSWRVLEDGIDITSNNNDVFVNGTYNVVLNVTNTTGVRPYTAEVNYSIHDGLNLRWNASTTSFTMTPVADVPSLSNLTRTNVTVAVQHDGQTDVFFDEQPYLLTALFNVSPVNTTPYYQEWNGSTHLSYLLQTCSATPSAPLNASDACFTNTSNSMTLYLPQFDLQDRILFGEIDDQAPNVTIQTAANISQSVIPLHLDVTTPNPNTTFCDYNLSHYNASNVSVTVRAITLQFSSFTLEGSAWDYKENITQMGDGLYNLSVTCADDQGESTTSLLNLEVNDSSGPVIFGVVATDIDFDEATISAQTDEPATFTVVYGTKITELTTSVEQTGGLTTIQGIVLGNLAASTLYYFNMTACDANNLCNSSNTSSFTTLSAPTAGRSAGGGGGGEEAGEVVGAEATDTRIWLSVEKDEVIDYAPKGLVITRVVLDFKNASNNVLVSIKQYPKLPQGVDNLTLAVYKYFDVDHDGLWGKVRAHTLEFTIDEGWVEDNGVLLNTLKLYRLEDDWTPYNVEDLGDNTYRASVPGFSWFAIAAQGRSVPQSGNQAVPLPVEQPVEEQPSGVPENSTFVSALDTVKKKGFPIFTVLGLVLLGAVLTVGGMQAYKFYQKREAEHKKEIEKEHEEYVAEQEGRVTKPVERPQEHDPTAELQAYIQRMRQHGYDDEHIKQRLHMVGWDSFIVEQELSRT